MSVSSNESENVTETMKYELNKIENKKNKNKNPAHSALGFQSLESFETNN